MYVSNIGGEGGGMCNGVLVIAPSEYQAVGVYGCDDIRLEVDSAGGGGGRCGGEGSVAVSD